ncbi:MAG: hypothetical protein JXA33_19910 [Anaerolineae bacterium]|nr:hypothetical protein [Anaerolineae bacterium]
MINLPITHMTLYKHGVGFFERRANLTGEQVELSFRVEEMNDILKSLTVIDWGGGQVLGIDYATPQSRQELLQGCSIRLEDTRSLRDLLAGLRGRRIHLLLDPDESLTGLVVGLDEPPERQAMGTTLVSLLQDKAEHVQVVELARVQGVEILDERGAADLRFFLETALGQEDYRKVTIRLTPGEHELSASYIAPAPTWRVSYRLVLESGKNGREPRALLLGWGIFDNRLEEDLESISLSLVAGMPISFIYDLYTPFTPERPEVKEEARVAAAPVEFKEAALDTYSRGGMGAGMGLGQAMSTMMRMAEAPAPAPAMARASLEDIAAAQTIATQGEDLGELFQYRIQTPVTVGRGRSAMVPVLSSYLNYRKDLIYNAAKMPNNPVATLRLKNETGLTLERGPVTVLEDGEYVGEAVLSFTIAGTEMMIPYAVELGVQMGEHSRQSRELHALHIKGVYLQFEEWDIRVKVYRMQNTTGEPIKVLIEHPRTANYELFDSPAPVEETTNTLRFETTVNPQVKTVLQVQERKLMWRQEELRKQSHQALQKYLKQGLLDRRVHDQIVKLLMLYDTIADYEKQLKQLEEERKKIYESQKQIQDNMGALSQTGKEGALRTRYVEQLETSEEQLKTLSQRENELKATIQQVETEIDARLKEMK